MRIAVVYNEQDIYVEFTPEVFKELLRTYLDKYKGDVDQVMEAIVSDLRKQTLYK